MAKSDGRPPPLRMGGTAAPAAEDHTARAMEQLGGAPGMVRTQVGHQTAITVTRPRNMEAVEKDILYEAAQMGEDFIYSWRQNTSDKQLDEGDGKQTIEGMSIEGAMIMIRNWGNCACPIELADETPTHFLLLATFIDLEKGFNFPRLYRQRKSGGPGGKMADDRKEDISFQIGQSKAQRNVIDKSLPPWLKKRAIAAAKSEAAKRYADVNEWAPKAIAYFAGLGITLQQIEERLRRARDEWTPYDILALFLIRKAILDRETTASEAFPKRADEQAQADADGVVTTEGEEVDEKPKDDFKAGAEPGATQTAQATATTQTTTQGPATSQPGAQAGGPTGQPLTAEALAQAGRNALGSSDAHLADLAAGRPVGLPVTTPTTAPAATTGPAPATFPVPPVRKT